MLRLSLIVPATTIGILLAVSTASTSGRAMMQFEIPQQSGVPEWCANDRDCWSERRALCEANEARSSGENLLMCLRGTPPAKDEQAGSDPASTTPGASGSSRTRPGRRRVGTVTDRRGNTRSQSSRRQDRRQDARRRARQGRRSGQVTDRRGLSGLGWSAQDKANLDACANAMLVGPAIKKIKIANHEFNCKPPFRWEEVGNVWFLGGELSHHLSRRKDDQVRYRFTLGRDGSLGDFDVNVKKGGLFPTINKVTPLNRINERLDPGYWNSATFGSLAGSKFEGRWRDVASIVVLTASNRLTRSFNESAPRMPRLSGEFFYYIDLLGSDIRRIDLRGDLATPDMCNRQCNLESDCKSWTLYRPNPNDKAAQCWLKDAVPQPRVGKGRISGLRDPRQVRPRLRPRSR